MHTTVFLEEAVRELNVQLGKKYIDATFGEGGHSVLIKKLGGEVLAIDLDPNQVAKHKDFKVVQGNFAEIEKIAKQESFTPVSGVIFDFGLSTEQIKTGGMGLSYRNDEEYLDMRLSGKGQTVAEYLEEVSREDLTEDLERYSEDINSKRIADAIVNNRKKEPVKNVYDLKRIIDKVLGRKSDIKTYARIFQALRIIVNDEIKSISKGLEGAKNILIENGIIVTITFHSIEDRIVKNFAKNNKEIFQHKRINVGHERKIFKFERSANLRVLIKK